MSTKKIEKQWWFELVCLFGALFVVGYLFKAVGLSVSPPSLARVIIWFLCFWGSNRFISFSLWLLVLMVAPKKITEQG